MDCLNIAQQLIAIDSVTSHPNHAIASLMDGQLRSLSFELERIEYQDNAGLDKVALIGRRGPAATSAAPGIVYSCHNDVVAVDGWHAPYGGAFEPVVADNRLWGRGACDMKGPIAAAMEAVARIPLDQQVAPIYFLVTGDEESGMRGAQMIVDRSHLFAEMRAAGTVGIIGEPSELRVVNAHKGGCHIHVTARGVAAHSSTADGRNANWLLVPFLNYLREQFERTESDTTLQNTSFTPPTLSMNVIVNNEPAASNITVGKASCHIFIRPMPNVDWRGFAEQLVDSARAMGLESHIGIAHEPLFTPAEDPLVQNALAIVGQAQPQSVCFATDGCSLSSLKHLLVLGPGSIEQAHRSDEWIALDQLAQAVQLYEQLFRSYAVARESAR